MVKYEPLQDKDIQNKLVQKAEVLKNRPRPLLSVNFGMIAALGGVIIMPIVLMTWLGNYLDEIWPQRFSWLVTLLFGGFLWGILNAAFWLKYENEKIERLTPNEDINQEEKKDNE